MRETPRSFTARRSIAYAPPERVAFLARRLDPDEPCPTLFRYPGPCGLADFFAGALRRLGPAGSSRDLLWLAERPLWRDTAGARFFGTLAVLQPLALGACAQGPGIWLAGNAPLDAGDDEAIVWVPPSAFARPIPWDDLPTAAAARPHLPADLAGERHRAVDALARYLEELDAMRRSGAPGPGVPWCQVPADERLARLAAAGVAPVWSAGIKLYSADHPA